MFGTKEDSRGPWGWVFQLPGSPAARGTFGFGRSQFFSGGQPGFGESSPRQVGCRRGAHVASGFAPATFAHRGAWVESGLAAAPRLLAGRPFSIPPVLCGAFLWQGPAPVVHLQLEPRPLPAPGTRPVLHHHREGLPVTSGLITSGFCLQTCISPAPKHSAQSPHNPSCVAGSAQGDKNQFGGELDRTFQKVLFSQIFSKHLRSLIRRHHLV